MKTLFFSKKPALLKRLPAFAGKSAKAFEARAMEELASLLPSLANAGISYIDVRGMAGKELGKVLSLISDHPEACFGLFDPAGAIEDVGSVFHAGAVDYLGKGMSPSSLTAKRRTAIEAYAQRCDIGQGDGEEAGNEIQPGSVDVWADVVPGQVYRFAFLYIDVDDAEEMKKRYEPNNLTAAMNTFRGYIEGIAREHGGRLWMWSRFGGLVLFPLRDNRSLAPVCALRILLSSIFYDIEESPLPGRLSFHMALSVGETVYRENDTGRIVSDAINSIFHLGQRCAKPGQFLCSAEAYDLVPQPLRSFFVPSGTFEGRRVLRMLRPSPFLGAREDGGACRS
jgi:class 3 adenylate cyclase